jgi:hypothetical protein
VQLLHFTGESVRLVLTKSKEIELGNPDFLVYGRNGILAAFSVARAISALGNKVIPVYSIYEFLYSVINYNQVQDFIVISSDKAEVSQLDSTCRALRVNSLKVTCARDLKLDRKLELDCELFDVTSAFSLLKSYLKTSPNLRGSRLRQELMEIRSVTQEIWSTMPDLRAYKTIVISPLLLPAGETLSFNLGSRVLPYDRLDLAECPCVVIYTGADDIVGRRAVLELNARGFKAAPFLLNYDPITAPIYLSILSYEIKNPRE